MKFFNFAPMATTKESTNPFFEAELAVAEEEPYQLIVWNDDVYYNSPQHYMPNLTDHAVLEQIRQRGHLHLLSGSGAYEAPDAARSFAGILYSKGIPYELDIWGSEWRHDWETWRAMLPHYIGTRF